MQGGAVAGRNQLANFGQHKRLQHHGVAFRNRNENAPHIVSLDDIGNKCAGLTAGGAVHLWSVAFSWFVTTTQMNDTGRGKGLDVGRR